MKVLMVTRESQADKRFGLGKSLAPVIARLHERGIEVGYLCQADAGARSVETVRTLHRVIVKLFGRFFTATEFSPLVWGVLERVNMGRLAAKVMARERYTHVHCHDPLIAAGYRWFARIRWFAGLRRGHTARWGVTEHGFGCYAEALHIDGAQLGSAVMRWLRGWEAKILLKAHWVMVPTHLGLGQLARDLSIHPIPASWYGIHHPLPPLNVYPKAEARARLHWGNEIHIIAVGRFAPLKQFNAIVDACAALPAGVQSWKLTFIGEGDSGYLQTLASQCGLVDKVSFAASDDMGLYYSAADIYVSTSLTESFGLANLEAVKMGLSSLCTAVGGVPEVVGSGAWLLPSQDKRALTQALCELIQSFEQREALSARARQWVKSWPELDNIVDAYIAMYEGQARPVVNSASAAVMPVMNAFHQETDSWRLCPLPKTLVLPEQEKILLIAPHPDDETLGCGGTLALLRQRGCEVKVVIMTDGRQGDPLGYSTQDVGERRQDESRAALKILGIEDVVFMGYPDGDYRHSAQISAELAQVIDSYNPQWLLMPSLLDNHRDHVRISLSLLELWQQRGCRERLFLYETWGAIPATAIVDISAVFTLKQQAIQCYQLPLQYCDYAAALAGLSAYRGLFLGNESHGPYAEAFLELHADSWQPLFRHLFGLRKYQEQRLGA